MPAPVKEVERYRSKKSSAAEIGKSPEEAGSEGTGQTRAGRRDDPQERKGVCKEETLDRRADGG
jgi:hypothetical protein